MSNLNVKRTERDIEKYIPLIIQREVKDEIIKSITITDCTLSNDLSYCKVYFTSILDLDKKTIEKKVNEASSFIRLKLASLIDSRTTPTLKFIYDTSIEYAQNIEDKIKEIHQK